MPYLQVELDAINCVDDVARAAKVDGGAIAYGLLRMWTWGFRAKSSTVTDTGIAGFFGQSSEALIDGLVTFGFLEPLPEGGYRIRGSSRYLSQSKAGKVRASQATRSGGKFEASDRPASHQRQPATNQRPTSDSPAAHQPETSDPPATDQPHQSPNTNHQSPLKAFAGMTPAGAPEALELTAPTDQPTHPKKPKATPTDPRLGPLTERLAREYEEARGVPYAHGGAKDTQALKSLLPLGDDDEISARWQWAIKQPITAWCCVSSFAQLRHKWNDIAASANPAQPRGSLHVVRHFEGDILRGAS